MLLTKSARLVYLCIISGHEVKLRELCEDLLGPVYKSKLANSWQDAVLVGTPMFVHQISPILIRYSPKSVPQRLLCRIDGKFVHITIFKAFRIIKKCYTCIII